MNAVKTTLKRAAIWLTLPALLALGCATAEPMDEAIGETPLSLTGTDIDGRLDVDVDGRFVITADAVRLFDYFLTTEGEIDDAARRVLVAAEARRLGPAAFEAMAFYDDYVEYRRRFDAAIQKAGPQADGPALVAQIRRLRAETVGDHPLFAEDDALVEQAVAAKRAMRDGDVGALARRMQVAALFTRKSAAEVEAERAARAALRLGAETAIAREAGADITAIHALRVEQVGEAAADRLARLDAERAAWRTRVDAARAAIAELDPHGADFAAEREALLDARFDDRERRRVRTILGLRAP